MKLFRILFTAILLYFSVFTPFHIGLYANNISGIGYEFNLVAKSDTARETPSKSLNIKGKRVYKNYLKPSYELSNYDEWLSSDDLYESGSIYFNPLLPGPLGIQQTCQLDIDGNGFEDLFYYDSYLLEVPIANPPPRVFMNNGTILEKTEWTGPSIINPHGAKLLVGDFNNDSLPDIFTLVGFDVAEGVDGTLQISHLLFNSSEGFKTVKEFSDQLGYHHTGCSGDIDNDGDLDVIMFNFAYWNTGVTSKILWNDGKGNFTYGTSGFSEIAPVNHSELFDINSDGFLDLVISYTANHLKQTNDMIVMWGNGKDFNLINSTSFEYPVYKALMDIDFTDINNDGISEIILSGTDILLGTSPDTGLKYFIDLYQSDDKGKTFIKKTDKFFDVVNFPNFGHMIVKDLNNNGLMDIYGVNRKDSIRWEWNGSKFMDKFPLPDSPIAKDYAFTSDGKINIVWERVNPYSDKNRQIKKWAIYWSDNDWSDTSQVSKSIYASADVPENNTDFDQYTLDATSKEMYIRISAIDSYGVKSKLSNLLKIAIPPPTIKFATICDGNNLTISGTNFIGVTGLTIGSSTIASYKVLSQSIIQADLNTGQSGSISIATVAGNVTSSDVSSIVPPSQPLVINGKKHPLTRTVETYSVPKTEGVIFEWSFPESWEQISGIHTNIVTVKIGNSDGTIKVIPSAFCGSLETISLPVSVYTYIPDDNFQKALRDLGIDKENKQDSVLSSSLVNVSSLNLESKNIGDLTGIQDFTALKHLECWDNQLKVLDLSGNILLEELFCTHNKLTSLNLSNNTMLRALFCDENQLSDLDISKNIALFTMGCGINLLTSLNTSNNKELAYLSAPNNFISSFDLSTNDKLLLMHCWNNRLTKLDVSQNLDLYEINCSDNQITNLDFSKNVKMNLVICNSNKLASLNLKNGNNSILTRMWADNNPNLTCINVDNPALASTYSEWKKDAIASYSENCPPVITSISPKIVCKGGTINITGANFTGVSSISFGGIPAVSFTVLSPTNISAIIEDGTSGKVSVTNSLGTATISGFKLISIPDIAGTITGSTLVNPGQNAVAYTVPSIANATSYIWTLPDGATGTSSTNSIRVNFSKAAVSGNITVKGHSDCGNGAESNLSIIVNRIPIAIAGSDQSVSEGSTVSLDGSLSSDPDGNSLTYKWTAPSGIILSSTSATNPTFIAPEIKNDTILILSLIVNDGFINSESSTVKVSVKNVIKTGSEILGMNGLKIFPNPSNGIFKIDGLPLNQKNKISVNTIDGKLIRKKIGNSTTETIDISNQVSGTYLLHVNSQTFKIVKK